MIYQRFKQSSVNIFSKNPDKNEWATYIRSNGRQGTKSRTPRKYSQFPYCESSLISVTLHRAYTCSSLAHTNPALSLALPPRFDLPLVVVMSRDGSCDTVGWYFLKIAEFWVVGVGILCRYFLKFNRWFQPAKWINLTLRTYSDLLTLKPPKYSSTSV